MLEIIADHGITQQRAYVRSFWIPSTVIICSNMILPDELRVLIWPCYSATYMTLWPTLPRRPFSNALELTRPGHAMFLLHFECKITTERCGKSHTRLYCTFCWARVVL